MQYDTDTIMKNLLKVLDPEAAAEAEKADAVQKEKTKAEVREATTQALPHYQPVFSENYYKKATSDYKEMLNKIAALKQRNAPVSIIRKLIDETSQKINQTLRHGADEAVAKAQGQVNQITNDFFAHGYHYDDPQAEALHRQDWQARVKSMTDTEVASFIAEKSADPDWQPNLYQWQVLKERTQGSKQLDKVDIQLELLKSQKNIGTEYANDTKYQNLAAQLGSNQAQQQGKLGANALWINKGAGYGFAPVEPKREGYDALSGYQPKEANASNWLE